MVRPPDLFAVVGPVDPRALHDFLTHYEDLGIGTIRLAVHIPMGGPDEIDSLLSVVRQHGISEPPVERGPWNEWSNREALSSLRKNCSVPGWHVVADVDEFHQYPCSLADLIEEADRAQATAVAGVLVDRVHPLGDLAPWPPDGDSDSRFSLGGFLTPNVLGGDPRKIVLARSGVDLEIGQHWSANAKMLGLDSSCLTLCHHFKWHLGVDKYLRGRKVAYESGEWMESGPAMRQEASRLLNYLKAHDGRIDPLDERSLFRPCSLKQRDSRLLDDAIHLHQSWDARFAGKGTPVQAHD